MNNNNKINFSMSTSDIVGVLNCIINIYILYRLEDKAMELKQALNTMFINFEATIGQSFKHSIKGINSKLNETNKSIEVSNKVNEKLISLNVNTNNSEIITNNQEKIAYNIYDYIYLDPVTLKWVIVVTVTTTIVALIWSFGGQTGAGQLVSAIDRSLGDIGTGINVTRSATVDVAKGLSNWSTEMYNWGIKNVPDVSTNNLETGVNNITEATISVGTQIDPEMINLAMSITNEAVKSAVGAGIVEVITPVIFTMTYTATEDSSAIDKSLQILKNSYLLDKK